MSLKPPDLATETNWRDYMTVNGLWVNAGQVVALTTAYKGTVHRHTLV